MKLLKNKKYAISARSLWWVVLVLVVMCLGISASVFNASGTNQRERQELLSRAETVAAGIHDDVVSDLSGTTADIGTDNYRDLKDQLVKIRAANPDAHFAYLMGFRDSGLFFYADSEPEGSEDISLPGDKYSDASRFKIDQAYQGIPFTEGPYSDQWGHWVSAYAPVVNHETGKLAAVAGMDIDAKYLERKVWFAALLPLGVMLGVLLVVFLLYWLQRRRVHFVQQLEMGEERLRSLYEITTHGEWKLAEQFRKALRLGSETLHTKIATLSHIENGKFTVEYGVFPANTLKEGDIFNLEETYCDITVKNDDVFSIDHMALDSHKAHACYAKFKLESYIGVPVKVFGQLHGTLAFLAPDPHRPAFSDSDRDFVRLMGKWMSASLERQQIEKMKSEFVSVASHQLRTPLTGIRWFTELILGGKAGKISKKQQDFLQQIYDSNDRMIKLVEDLLNVSRIDTGQKFEIKKAKADVVAIIDSLATDVAGLAHQHGVQIKKSPDFPQTCELMVDADKIRQVFGNLLSNAAKYSKQGGVVEIGLQKEQGGVRISIKDTGLGIPKNQQHHMFEKFFRADNVKTQETDGTGLGLYIAKAVVEGHGGKIWFESQENIGTTFFVSLPT